MELRVLGPLEVLDDEGRPLTVAGRQERRLLGALAVRAGETVSVDRLVEELWGDEPPGNELNALQAIVSRLRRTIGKDVLVTRPPGYALEIPRRRLDAARFEDAVVRVRAVGIEDPGAASRGLASALVLWRGEPYADLAYETFVQAEAARLVELRLLAIEEKAEADLALGRHTDVVGALEPLAAEHPTRERMCGLAMLALARGGRQADAIEAYERTRRALADELGLDPSLELRDLHASVLRQEGAVAERPTAVAVAAPGAELPARVTSFVGRRRELADLDELLARHRLVTVAGPGGVGKTSLAIQAARARADAYADGVRFVELTAVTDGSLVAQAVAADLELGADVGEPADAERRLLEHLARRELLLILDNCEQVVGACAALIDTLLRRAAGLRVLATSREALAVPGEVVWPLPPLDTDVPSSDAVALFLERARAARPGLAEDDAMLEAADHVCRRLDGIPLALELAAARVRAMSVADVAARLDDRFALLTDGGRTASPRQRTLRGALDWSHDLLAEDERVAFGRLGVFAGAFDLAAAESVVADGEVIERGTVLDLLARLVDRSLLIVDDARRTTRYRMLETVRDYARERLAEAEDETVADRHTEHFISLAEAAFENRGRREWLATHDEAADDLRAALTRAIEGGNVEVARRFGAALGWYWAYRAPEEGVRELTAILELGEENPSPALAGTLVSLGMVGRYVGGTAWRDAASRALEVANAVGDRSAISYAHLHLALRAFYEGADPGQAERHLDEAERGFHEVGDAHGEAIARYVASEVAVARGQLERGLEEGRRAVRALRAVGDEIQTSVARMHLAMATTAAGDLAEAERLHEEARALARELGLPYYVCGHLVELGRLAAVRGDLERARELHAEGLALARETGVGWVEANLLDAMGNVAREVGDDPAEARRLHERALEIVRERAPAPRVAFTLRCLGLAEIAAGVPDAAEPHLRDALERYRAAGDRPGRALTLEALAAVHAARGRSEDAAKLLDEAAELLEGIRSPAMPLERADVEAVRSTIDHRS